MVNSRFLPSPGAVGINMHMEEVTTKLIDSVGKMTCITEKWGCKSGLGIHVLPHILKYR